MPHIILNIYTTIHGPLNVQPITGLLFHLFKVAFPVVLEGILKIQ